MATTSPQRHPPAPTPEQLALSRLVHSSLPILRFCFLVADERDATGRIRVEVEGYYSTTLIPIPRQGRRHRHRIGAFCQAGWLMADRPMAEKGPDGQHRPMMRRRG